MPTARMIQTSRSKSDAVVNCPLTGKDNNLCSILYNSVDKLMKKSYNILSLNNNIKF